MKITEHKATQNIRREASVKVIRIEHNLNACKIEIINRIAKSDETAPFPFIPNIKKEADRQLLIDDENLKKLLSGKLYKGIEGLYVITNEGLRSYQENSISDPHNEWYWGKGVSEAPFDIFESGSVTADNVVKIDHGHIRVFDRHGTPLVKPLVFDYMNGHIHNGTYDLEKAYERLKSNPRVKVYASNSSRRPVSEKEAKDFSEALRDIPYYNSGRHHTQQLYFVWSPTNEEYQKVYQAAKKNPKKEPLSTDIYNAVFTTDALGLRECGAAYYDEPYLSREDDEQYQNDDDDNDFSYD